MDVSVKNHTAIDVKASDRVYKFLCDVDSPLGQAYDAISKVKSKVIEIMNRLEPDYTNRWETKVCDRDYIFLSDPTSSVGEFHDALTAMQAHVVSIINQANEAQKQAAQPPKTEE